MDVDDDAHSGGSVPSNPSPPHHPTGLHSHPPLVIPSLSSSSTNVLRGAEDVPEIHGLTWQRRDIFRLQPSILEPTTRKRKHSDDAPHPDTMVHDDVFGDGSNPRPFRRVRPRVWGREDREFSPLLIMSPTEELHEEEETVSAFHYPPDLTNPSHSIQRCFDIGNPPERGPSILQSSSSSRVDDLDDHTERRRSNSANSLAEIALASIVTPPRGRLSTLQDLCLPCPFEEGKQSSSSSGGHVHERGLEAGPLFLSTKPGRTGTSEPVGSPRFAVPSLEMGTTRYFDKPLCESPDSIDPADGGLT